MIAAAAEADKQSCSSLRAVDMFEYIADGPTSSDCKACACQVSTALLCYVIMFDLKATA